MNIMLKWLEINNELIANFIYNDTKIKVTLQKIYQRDEFICFVLIIEDEYNNEIYHGEIDSDDEIQEIISERFVDINIDINSKQLEEKL